MQKSNSETIKQLTKLAPTSKKKTKYFLGH